MSLSFRPYGKPTSERLGTALEAEAAFEANWTFAATGKDPSEAIERWRQLVGAYDQLLAGLTPRALTAIGPRLLWLRAKARILAAQRVVPCWAEPGGAAGAPPAAR